MSIYTLFYLLFIHWIADFVLQTDEEAKGKSTSNHCLMGHLTSYTGFMVLGVAVLQLYLGAFDLFSLSTFGMITFWLHGCTDYVTSRLNTKLWKKGDVHNFFVSVGFDQFLHYVQLILTYKYIFR